MSDRTFYLVASTAGIALVAVLVASYFLHRLTLAPTSLFLLFVLVGIPVAGLLRSAPALLMAAMMPTELRERLAEMRRDAGPSRANPLYVLSLVSSYAWVFCVVVFVSPSSTILVPMTFAALLPFFIGYFGLLFNSVWIQRHVFVVPIVGVAMIALSAGLFALGIADELLGEGFLMLPLFMFVTGGQALGAPVLIIILRSSGIID